MLRECSWRSLRVGGFGFLQFILMYKPCLQISLRFSLYFCPSMKINYPLSGSEWYYSGYVQCNVTRTARARTPMGPEHKTPYCMRSNCENAMKVAHGCMHPDPVVPYWCVSFPQDSAMQLNRRQTSVSGLIMQANCIPILRRIRRVHVHLASRTHDANMTRVPV